MDKSSLPKCARLSSAHFAAMGSSTGGSPGLWPNNAARARLLSSSSSPASLSLASCNKNSIFSSWARDSAVVTHFPPTQRHPFFARIFWAAIFSRSFASALSFHLASRAACSAAVSFLSSPSSFASRRKGDSTDSSNLHLTPTERPAARWSCLPAADAPANVVRRPGCDGAAQLATAQQACTPLPWMHRSRHSEGSSGTSPSSSG
mmetsp:Transcript_7122/g.17711  ORF Transcript_7122/g.17711 Transcript_7122/m.17711 type:complete len:205 (-) Transcript_7122:1780-2394(-)